ILSCVVNSNFRGNGFGSLLLKESEKVADKLNCKVITLNSGIRTERVNAHKFYNANGFESESYVFSKSTN
ncbi:GNAT family N-acetyltransferase, partial [Staphylococcus aureus]